MKLSALTSSLPLELPAAIDQLAELCFEWIDVPPAAGEGKARRRLDERHLRVACVSLERGMPSGMDLASPDDTVRSATIEYFRHAIELTGKLDAPVAYLTPPRATDEATRRRWSDSLVQLADCARDHAVRVAIEHFPRRLLPTAAGTLLFLEQLGHDQLALLLDVGHCLISGEDPARVIADAGRRLGYVHFDDNDGQEDRHWPLLVGKLTEQQIRETIAGLRKIRYDGALCLELQSGLDDPVGNLRSGKALLQRLLGE